MMLYISIKFHENIVKGFKVIEQTQNDDCQISKENNYEGPAKSFVTGFGLLQCYVLSNILLLQTFKVFPLY